MFEFFYGFRDFVLRPDTLEHSYDGLGSTTVCGREGRVWVCMGAVPTPLITVVLQFCSWSA